MSMAETAKPKLEALKSERSRIQKTPVDKRTAPQRKRLEYITKQIRRLESQPR